jgi:hypothetical protein
MADPLLLIVLSIIWDFNVFNQIWLVSGEARLGDDDARIYSQDGVRRVPHRPGRRDRVDHDRPAAHPEQHLRAQPHPSGEDL